MKIFNHEGCHSGKCVWKEHGMACLIGRELSNKTNHEMEKRRGDELLNEAARLLEETRSMGQIDYDGYQERLPNTDPDEFKEVK